MRATFYSGHWLVQPSVLWCMYHIHIGGIEIKYVNVYEGIHGFDFLMSSIWMTTLTRLDMRFKCTYSPLAPRPEEFQQSHEFVLWAPTRKVLFLSFIRIQDRSSIHSLCVKKVTWGNTSKKMCSQKKNQTQTGQHLALPRIFACSLSDIISDRCAYYFTKLFWFLSASQRVSSPLCPCNSEIPFQITNSFHTPLYLRFPSTKRKDHNRILFSLTFFIKIEASDWLLNYIHAVRFISNLRKFWLVKVAWIVVKFH